MRTTEPLPQPPTSGIPVSKRPGRTETLGLPQAAESFACHLEESDSTSRRPSKNTIMPSPCLLPQRDLEESAPTGANEVKARLTAWTESAATDFVWPDDTSSPFSSEVARFGMPSTSRKCVAPPLGVDAARVALPCSIGRGEDALEMALVQLCAAQASALQQFREDMAALQPQLLPSSAPTSGATEVGGGPPTSSPRPSCATNESPKIDDLPLSIETESVNISQHTDPTSNQTRVSVKLAFSTTGLLSDPKAQTSLLGKMDIFVRSPMFESSVALLIFCNTIVMALEAQWKGLQIGYDITFYDEGELGWHGAEVAFGLLEFIFGALFALELSIKIVCLRMDIFRDCWNYLDSIIVAAWFLSQFSGSAADASPVHPSLLRLVRLVRLLRLVRLMHYMRGFDSLLIMTTSMRGSVSILFWTGVVLALALMLCALMLQAACESYLAGDAAKEGRELVFMYYGTFSRCFLTMFELTMGNWMPPCRALVENVNEWFMIFFLLHKLIIGFSVLSVVNGVFMQETFKVASLDDHIMLLQKERISKMHKEKMRALFNHFDDDCDGLVSLEEFKVVLDDPHVRQWLSAMEMDVRDVDTAFLLLDTDGSQCLTIDELVAGVSRLKGTARAIDVATLLHEERERWRAVEVRGLDGGGAQICPCPKGIDVASTVAPIRANGKG